MIVPLWIDGSEVEGFGAIERENPARPDEIVGCVAVANAALTSRAVHGARRAFSAWAAICPQERVKLVRDAVEAVALQNEDRALVLARELGKVVSDARGELAFVGALAEFYAEQTLSMIQDIIVDDEHGRLVTVHEPYGVIAAITPWNAPVILASLKVLPALMTGNTIVLKPSPLAPLVVTEFLSAIARRLPAGVLNVVNGGADVGATLVGHPEVDKISFTGGLSTARAIAASAADRVVPTVMELGGNDAAIFLPDAEYTESMYERALFGAFLNSGQVCMAIKRMYVPERRLDEFVQGIVTVAEHALVVGDPTDPHTTMGPVVSRRDQQRLLALVESAVDAGGTVHQLGTFIPPSEVNGYWVRPTIVTRLSDEHELITNEQFGPVVPVIGYTSVDDAVERANAVPHGLASSVWSTDEDRALSVARRLNAGFTFLNSHNRAGMSLRASFGGRGISGHGREFGAEGVMEYLQTHSINLPSAIRDGSARGNAYPTSRTV